MSLNARYVHTNLVARDWRRLARFYEEVFGCTRIPPERDLSGPGLEAATGIPKAHLRGIHLRLPGHGNKGPTLEIFEYDSFGARPETALNRPGFAHIAFIVDDVGEAHRKVLDAGGSAIGEKASLVVPGAGTVTMAYMMDPEGNIVEIQSWTR